MRILGADKGRAKRPCVKMLLQQASHTRTCFSLANGRKLRNHPSTSAPRGRLVMTGVLASLGKLFGSSDDKKDGPEGGGGILSWARSAQPQCELAPAQAPDGLELATFAGGCFWGLELAYQRVPGVVRTSVGYTKGKDASPNYNTVCSGMTGYAEAVQVTYDPKDVGYPRLLDTFFEHVDPTTRNRQGGDAGTQYRSAIYFHTPEQRAAAQAAVADVNERLQQGTFRRVWGKEVVSELEPASDYWIAEKYHQQYLAKGGRFGLRQSAEKGATDKIRCYG